METNFAQRAKAERAIERVVDTVLRHFVYYNDISGEFIVGVLSHEHFNGDLREEDFKETHSRVRAALREKITKSKTMESSK